MDRYSRIKVLLTSPALVAVGLVVTRFTRRMAKMYPSCSSDTALDLVRTVCYIGLGLPVLLATWHLVDRWKNRRTS